MTGLGRILVVAATATVLLAVSESSASMALEELRSANLAEVKGGIRLGWLLGHSVINDQNEKIGTVADFVVGNESSLFAVLQIGGFLGFDTYFVAVPFKTLMIDKAAMWIHLPGAREGASKVSAVPLYS